MPTTIYIWKPCPGSVGHASMTLNDGTHISWWPANLELKVPKRIRYAFSSQGNPSPNLKTDIEREHGLHQDETYSLPKDVINEDAIKRWWLSFSSTEKYPIEEYRVINQNCCHVVFKALEVGNTTKFFEDAATKNLGKTLLTPLDIKALVESLIKGHTYP